MPMTHGLSRYSSGSMPRVYGKAPGAPISSSGGSWSGPTTAGTTTPADVTNAGFGEAASDSFTMTPYQDVLRLRALVDHRRRLPGSPHRGRSTHATASGGYVQRADFEALTNPRSVAVVGASDPERSWFGGRAFRNLVAGDPDRRLYAVNPRLAGEELLGRPVHADVASLPETPDLTVIVTPAATVPAVLEDVGSSGCRRVLLCSANRDDDARAEYEVELRERVTKYGLSLVGGNSMGIISPLHDFAATFSSASDGAIAKGSTAYIGQSGAAVTYMLAALRGTPVGYSHLISTGDEVFVRLPEILEAVVDDDATESIVLFLEGTAQGTELRRVFTKARTVGKPVVVLKVGRTDVGRKAAQSHTGRLTGDDDVYRALFA